MSYLRSTPNRDGFFGEYGGAMLPPPLEPHFAEIREAYDKISKSAEFVRDLRYIRINRDAIDFAEDAVRQFEMPAETFEKSGKINAAAGEIGARHNREYAQHLDHLGEDYERLSAADMRDLCGSDYYSGGLRTPGTAVLQPVMYIRGLADGLLQQGNCRLFENTAVSEYARVGDRWKSSG